MLNSQTIDIVKQTAPVIAETGPKLTAHFYERMFKHNPELKDVFNMSNQRNGDQREALFNAICAYAQNIENLAALLPAVEKIAQKHTSFQITESQYAIVGEHLLATIDELLSPGDAVLNAWGEAYGVLANIFITREEEIYQHNEQRTGGWRGKRAFKVIDKREESEVITSFVFEPVDGKPVVDYQVGQYLGIYLNHDDLEHQEIRQYSLSDKPNGNTYRISVKREAQGAVSNHLHQFVKQGDIVQLVPPSGDFFLNSESQNSVVLLSAGVGLTPMLAMLELLATQNERSVRWLHATQHGGTHAFGGRVRELASACDHISSQVWYETPLDSDVLGKDYDYSGMMDLGHQQFEDGCEFYFCGPIGFMQSVAKQLKQKGVAEGKLNYEVFGPHKVV